MGLLTFLGCLMTSYGLPFSMFVFTIARDPVRIIILILSAFFWLLSLLCSSLLWFAVVPLRDQLYFSLIFSVAFQEIFRLSIYLLLRKADDVLKKLTENENTRIFDNKHILSYVVGFGFGLMSGAFSSVNILADASGPGTLGFNGQSPSFFIISALSTLAMILLHTAWNIITFTALDNKNYLQWAAVIGAHYLVSSLSLLNQMQLYIMGVWPAYVILVLSIFSAYFLAGGSVNSLKACFTMKRPTTHQVTTEF